MIERIVRKALPVLLLTAALALLFPALGMSAQAPGFSLPAANRSGDIALSNYRGQVVLINFWATWCPPCRQEIPSMIKLQQEFGPRGFTVIGLSMDEGGKGIVARFAKKAGINYPVAMANEKVADEFGGVMGIPASFLISRSGTIIKSYLGFTTHDTLQKDIAAQMNK